jgi:hypothetical protein
MAMFAMRLANEGGIRARAVERNAQGNALRQGCPADAKFDIGELCGPVAHFSFFDAGGDAFDLPLQRRLAAH